MTTFRFPLRPRKHGGKSGVVTRHVWVGEEESAGQVDQRLNDVTERVTRGLESFRQLVGSSDEVAATLYSVSLNSE